MKPFLENIKGDRGESGLVVYKYETDFFPFKWHYHPEYELTLIVSGKGKRMVGDSHEDFAEGDLILLGPNLPHTWVSEPDDRKASAIVIQFPESFIRPILQYEAFKSIDELLKQANHGLFFYNYIKQNVAKVLEQLPNQDDTKKLLGVLDVLSELGNTSNRKLSSHFKLIQKNEEAAQRINKVCKMIHQHSDRPFTIAEMAVSVHLSPGAFCKFFKKNTGKTFSDYINDIRISHACKLILESDKSVTEIAYTVGFGSISYFNRVFYRKKNCTPLRMRTQFRRHHHG